MEKVTAHLKIHDLTGQQFGKLTVTKLAAPIVNGGRKQKAWVCRCECGATKSIRDSSLKRGYSRSCGCLRTGRPMQDLTGKIFGRLTVIERTGRTKSGNVKWLCRCECGRSSVVAAGNLKYGCVRSCGCLHIGQSVDDLTGMVFGRLVVLRQAGTKCGNATWVCRCSCGNVRIVWNSSLRKGTTVSCGCYSRDLHRTAELHPIRHGHARRARGRSPEYNSWLNMIQRCTNRKNRRFASYGGVGVKVCKQWRDSFAAFLADVGPRPKGTSIGRNLDIGWYEPGNCRWMTHAEQVAEQQKKRRVMRALAGLSIAA